jgi:L-2-hydroxyglutarate oxidase LhgO
MNVLVVGGGIVGLATAAAIARRHRRARLRVLEKELAPGLHQTGRNSGVIHSGIYYKPGSAKALRCREGRELLLELCRRAEIPHDLCGKVIVAGSVPQIPRLDELARRGQANGVRLQRLDAQGLARLEPHARGLQALHVQDAGIVDYDAVVRLLCQQAGELILGAEVLSVRGGDREIAVETTAGDFSADWMVNCAGLHCDRVSRLAGATPSLRIVPFKGEYYRLRA